MSNKKYLYYYDFMNILSRLTVCKETGASYFVGCEGQFKVNKSTMRINDGFGLILFIEESKKMKDQYCMQAKLDKILIKYHKKLDKLRLVDDLETINKIMEIEVKK